MKTKSIVMIVLSLLLVLSVISASAAEVESQETVATVAFREATPEFVELDPELEDGNMSIDFDTQDLPLGEETYTAEDGKHTLRLADRRSNAGGWSVLAALSSFVSTSPDKEFEGTIQLGTPTYSEGLAPNSTLDLISNALAINIVTANTGLDKGYYDVIWADKTISLHIDDIAAGIITEAASYTAEITWTLDLT